MRSILVRLFSTVPSPVDADAPIIATPGAAPRSARSLKTWHLALVTAVVGTVAYYLPLLGALMPGHAHWPGFLLTGDQRMGYFPSFVEGYRRFWHGGLLGIDFLTDDGASVFAYRPNLMPFYPPFLLAYLLVDCSDLRTGVLAFVAIHVAHQFVGLYFTVVFVRRYLGFPSGAAVLAATVYGLTWYAATYAGEATFYFQIMMVPVAACALCWLMRARSPLAPIWMSPVFVTFALTNYGPTMLASLGLAVVAALIAFSLWEPTPGQRRLRALVPPLLSLALAGLACAPYFYAQLKFKAVMAATADDIDPVAHTLALTAYDLVNGLSPFLDIRRTHYEAILTWGAVPIFLCLFGLDVLLTRKGRIRPRYPRAVGLAALVYLVTLLPTLGNSLLAAADAFYYAVPFLGKMHIFQRYLAFSNFFFAIAVAGLATIGVLYASPGAKRVAAYGGIAIWLGVTVACLIWPPAPPTDTNSLLVEVFFVAVAGIAVAAAPPNPALVVVSMLCALTGLYNAYAIPLSTNRLSVWTTEPDPLGSEIGDIVSFVKANDDGKALSKLVLASAVIEGYFNRNLPWLLGKQVKIMNFHGYPPHLAVVADYLPEAYSAFGVFNIPWLQAAGADFVFWNDAARAPLEPLLAAGYAIGPTLTLPGGNVLGKLTRGDDARAAPPLLDLRPDNAAAWPKAMELDGWAAEGGRIVKTADRQSRLAYTMSETPGHAYDVDFDADVRTAGHLSVAFASQVLAGLDAAGEAATIHFHQRVDAAAVGDLWITASPTFTGSLSNITVKAVVDAAAEEAAGFDNGILRVSGPEGAVQGFGTNYTQRMRLILDAPTSRTVTYLLWPNPYMVPYLDGRQAAWTDASARPLSIDVGPGRHTLEVRFDGLSGQVFVWGQLAYIILALAASIAELARRPAFARVRGRMGRNNA